MEIEKKFVEVDVECSSCGGTGVYVGFAEKDGIAVVCSTCSGAGHYIKKNLLWSGVRRIRDKVTMVVYQNVGVVLEPGIDPHEITYEEFLAGKMPQVSTKEEVYISAAVWKQKNKRS